MEAKKNLMLVFSSLPLGGAENIALELSTRLLEYFNVSMICILNRGELADEFEKRGIPVNVIPFKSRWHPASLYKLAAFMRSKRIDIVQTHMYRPNISGIMSAWLARVPVKVATVHSVNHWDNNKQCRTDSLIAFSRDRVIAVSEEVKRNYVQRTGFPVDKCVVIRNGIPVERFQQTFDVNIIKKQLGFSPADKIVGIVARFDQAKDHLYFLEMAKIVSDKTNNVKFLLVGWGPEETKIKQKISELKLGDKVVLAGKRLDIPEILSTLTVSVLSSVREGLSLALMESLAAGVPIIATDVGGNKEVVVDGKCGYLVPRNAPETFADRVLKITGSDNIRNEMSLFARRRAVEEFSIEQTVKKTASLFFDVLKE